MIVTADFEVKREAILRYISRCSLREMSASGAFRLMICGVEDGSLVRVLGA